MNEVHFMNREQKYQANPLVSCGIEDEGAVLYNPDTDETSIINPTGLDIWRFLETPHSSAEVIEYLLQNYTNTSIEQVTEDIMLFLEKLTPDFVLITSDDA